MVSQDRIIEYFADQGVKVSYNTLGGTEDLVRAYVFDYEDVVKNSKTEKSEHSKISIYQEIYDIEPRTKLTGFEKLTKKDRAFRTKVSGMKMEMQWYSTMPVDTEREEKPFLSYKETLKNYLKTIDKPMLYLSGGIDSELVALAMLDAGVKFDTVIFEFLDKDNNIINKEELSYATKFVQKHNIEPVVKKLNVEELWEKSEFLTLTEAIQLPSPQLITHAYMIKTMCEEFSNHTHLFGGEVRFYTHHWLDDGRKASLVLLTKLVTPGYNGNTYYDTGLAISGDIPGLLLLYYYNTGTPGSWEVAASIGGILGSGSWANTTPTGAFEYRISALTLNSTPLNMVYDPSSAPTAWTTLSSGTATALIDAHTQNGEATSSFDGTYTVQVRSVTTPANLVSATITFVVNNA